MKIVIELDHTDSAELISAVLSAVSGVKKEVSGPSNAASAVEIPAPGPKIRQRRTADAPPAETVTLEETEQKPEDIGEVKEEAPPTIEQIRGLVAEKLKAGHKEKVKAWVSEYGAEGVSTIPADKYADFMAKLKTL